MLIADPNPALVLRIDHLAGVTEQDAEDPGLSRMRKTRVWLSARSSSFTDRWKPAPLEISDTIFEFCAIDQFSVVPSAALRA
ncbi:MAG: hypothetical protein EB078_10390 [Proteobacteria bacterium]|nr:hypothetical protein [Pseudomonadota bacterium]